jgi:hypothetical protein
MSTTARLSRVTLSATFNAVLTPPTYSFEVIKLLVHFSPNYYQLCYSVSITYFLIRLLFSSSLIFKQSIDRLLYAIKVR